MSHSSHPTTPSVNALPLVVRVGFAGARALYRAELYPDIDPTEFEEAVQRQFQHLLSRELETLDLGPQLFLCGVSALAIGGDTVFTKTCQRLGILQRVFLPQPREEFLTAVGSAGPDFSQAQQETARQLLASPHIIQERVVSNAADRRDRFHDVNLELVRVSDIVVCLVREDQAEKLGGTREVVELAGRRKRPVLEVQVAVRDGAPVLTSHWYHREDFNRPALPPDIASAELPAEAVRNPYPQLDDYVRGLKDFTSGRANWGRKHFAKTALAIIAAHVLATILAVLALKLHGPSVAWLLFLELLFLAAGFSIHRYLHTTHRVKQWAMARLAAEVARSISSLGRVHLYPEYLFHLPFPASVRPLLHTINVLHLHATRPCRSEPWEKGMEQKRDEYVLKRLTSTEHKAQIPYNEATENKSSRWLRIAQRTFLIASLTAFLATLVKLFCVLGWFTVHPESKDFLTAVMGFSAVVLPVIAVAALSLAAAYDLEARRAESQEMREFLIEQQRLLEAASSTREFSRLVVETESRLLGETVNWYARRTFLGVA